MHGLFFSPGVSGEERSVSVCVCLQKNTAYTGCHIGR